MEIHKSRVTNHQSRLNTDKESGKFTKKKMNTNKKNKLKIAIDHQYSYAYYMSNIEWI